MDYAELNDQHQKLKDAVERVNNLEYPKSSQEPLDNPDQTTDNLTMSEQSQQLQETEIIKQTAKELITRQSNNVVSSLVKEAEVEMIRNQTIDNLALNLHTPITIDQQKLWSKWYASGVKAKKRGFERLPPFYLKPTSDYFFYCGFDGVKFEDAVVNLEDSMNHIGDI